MTLDEWRIKKGYTVSELAWVLRCKQPTVYVWCKGNVTPTLSNIKKIKKVTKGKVSFDDWMKGEQADE